MLGAYGTRAANYAIQNCDLLLVLGSRLDVRQTGANCAYFANKANVIQIDIDQAQLENRVTADLSIEAKLDGFFEYFLKQVPVVNPECNEWARHLVDKFTETFVDEYSDWKLSPFEMIRTLNQATRVAPTHYTVDVGNGQMWVAHTVRLNRNQMMLHSGGLGAMGFAIPSAIGVHLVTGDAVIALVGDGGAQVNIQELDVLAREGYPILVVVMNNYSLGMIRTFQQKYYDGRDAQTDWEGYSCSFEKIGIGYNLATKTVDDIPSFVSAIESFMSAKKPTLIEVLIPDAQECRPRLEFGRPVDQQSPIKDIST